MDVIICRRLSVSKGTGPGFTILLTSCNDKILIVRHNENLAKGIANAVPNLSTLSDHLWCIGGHDKLVHCGIHIYAAVDAFSREAIWVYVGNANRPRIAVARQYLQTVDALDWCPRFIRADKGQEAVLLADTHLRLFLDHRHTLGDDQSTLDTLPVADCFFFDASSANQRIENWWLRIR